MSIIESATRLFDLLASRSDAFTKHLQPGLSREQIALITSPIGYALPQEIIDFYSRFNLPQGYSDGPDSPAFYGIYWLAGLEDAVQEWKFRHSLGIYDEHELKRFPFLIEDDNRYLVDLVPDAGGSHRIISEFHACGSRVQFRSLEAMFDTFYDCACEGLVDIESGHIDNYLDVTCERTNEIATRHNPGIWEQGTYF